MLATCWPCSSMNSLIWSRVRHLLRQLAIPSTKYTTAPQAPQWKTPIIVTIVYGATGNTQAYCNYRSSSRGQLTLAQNSLPGIDFSHAVPVELKTTQVSCMFDSNDLHPESPFGQYAFTGLGRYDCTSAILRCYRNSAEKPHPVTVLLAHHRFPS